MTQITLALTKGRILKETLPLLEAAGIVPAEDIFSSRKLVFDTNREGLRLLILRGSDVPTYVRKSEAITGAPLSVLTPVTMAVLPSTTILAPMRFNS